MKLKNLLLVITCFGLLVSCSESKNTKRVTTSARQIIVDESPYFIKGICYHPVPKGSNQRDFGTLDQDLVLMKEAGINTIRVYAPIDNKEVLDKIHDAGMKLIIGFGYNQGGNFDILSGSFLDYVNKYKDHPSILLWELGNEYNYHPEWFDGDVKNWYKALNNAADIIHKNDANHPVTTAHGEVPDSLALAMNPNIDVWGMNIYRWDNPGDVYSQWKTLSDKPMYLSEAGGDSYMSITKAGYEQGVNQQAQANANAKILDIVLRNKEIGSGVTMFSFTDGWWKAGNPDQQDKGGWAPNSTGVPYDGAPNEEYWGIVNIDREKKLAFDVIKNKYKSLKKE